MTYGPVDILALEFEGNKFNGAILDSLIDLVERKIVRVIDLIIVTKDGDGAVTAVEFRDLNPGLSELFAPLDAQVTGLIAEADVLAIGDALHDNSTAAMLLYENLWAIQFKEAVLEADGIVLIQERIPHEVVVNALIEIAKVDEA